VIWSEASDKPWITTRDRDCDDGDHREGARYPEKLEKMTGR